MPTIGDLITDAYTEIRVARAGDALAPELMERGLGVLNRLLDLWNADDRKVVSEGFNDYPLTPSLSPHTIGLGGTFNVAQRPDRLLFASVNIGGTPASFVPINVRDEAWYQRQPVPDITNSFPTDVYYQAAWPLGKLYFWGVPLVAWNVRLWTRGVLTAVVQGDTFSLPPGNQEALTLTLAERLAPGAGQKVSTETKEAARQARAAVFANHDEVPRLVTKGAGVPNAGGGRSGSGFNWQTRSFT